jgi:O-antigen/teichoic acid export membrane protein
MQLKSVSFTVLGRILNILASLITVALLASFFSDDSLATYLVLVATFTAINGQDFGIASALRIRISNFDDATRALASERDFKLVVCLVAVITVISLPVLLLPGMGPELIGLHAEASEAYYFMIGLAILSVVGAASGHCFYAYLEGWKVGWLDGSRAVMQVLAASLCYFLETSFFLTVCLVYSPWLLFVVMAYREQIKVRRWSATPWRLGSGGGIWNGRVLLEIIKQGIPLWLFQLVLLCFIGIDVPLGARLSSALEAGELSLVLRLINLLTGIVGVAFMSYLGLYAIKFKAGDKNWFAFTLSIQLLAVVAGGIIFGVVIVGLGDALIQLWVGREIQNQALLLWSGPVAVSILVFLVMQNLLMGIGKVGGILLPLLALVALKLGLAAWLVQSGGIANLMAISAACNAIAALMMAAYFIVKLGRIRTAPHAASTG